MISSRFSRALFAGCLAVFAVTGCLRLKPAQDATRFYVLTATPSANARVISATGPAVVLGRVEVADYLKTPQLVIRVGTNRIEYASMHHWAEPLDAALPRVLGENLLLRLGPRSPSVHGTPSREIRVNFLRFDLAPDGAARTEVICRMLDADSREVLVEQRLAWETPAPENPTDFDAAVAALSAHLGTLADEAIALARRGRP